MFRVFFCSFLFVTVASFDFRLRDANQCMQEVPWLSLPNDEKAIGAALPVVTDEQQVKANQSCSSMFSIFKLSPAGVLRMNSREIGITRTKSLWQPSGDDRILVSTEKGTGTRFQIEADRIVVKKMPGLCIDNRGGALQLLPCDEPQVMQLVVL